MRADGSRQAGRQAGTVAAWASRGADIVWLAWLFEFGERITPREGKKYRDLRFIYHRIAETMMRVMAGDIGESVKPAIV